MYYLSISFDEKNIGVCFYIENQFLYEYMIICYPIIHSFTHSHEKKNNNNGKCTLSKCYDKTPSKCYDSLVLFRLSFQIYPSKMVINHPSHTIASVVWVSFVWNYNNSIEKKSFVWILWNCERFSVYFCAGST